MSCDHIKDGNVVNEWGIREYQSPHSDDFDVMTERLTSFAVREEPREKLKELAEEYR
jgi:hypothetical protein